jgi:hypothetical protein
MIRLGCVLGTWNGFRHLPGTLSNLLRLLGVTMMLISDGDDLNYPVMYCLVMLSLFVGTFFAFLIWLFQPIIIENPGVAAYHPPPGTRLVPLPRNIPAPQVAEIPTTRNLAVIPPVDNTSRDLSEKKSSTRVAKLRPLRKIIPRWYAERAFAYERPRTDFRGSGGRDRFWF